VFEQVFFISSLIMFAHMTVKRKSLPLRFCKYLHAETQDGHRGVLCVCDRGGEVADLTMTMSGLKVSFCISFIGKPDTKVESITEACVKIVKRLVEC